MTEYEVVRGETPMRLEDMLQRVIDDSLGPGALTLHVPEETLCWGYMADISPPPTRAGMIEILHRMVEFANETAAHLTGGPRWELVEHADGLMLQERVPA